MPPYQPPSCCLSQPACPNLPPECPELLLAQTCPQTPGALFSPSIPCSSPSLSPPHSSPIQCQKLPPATPEDLRVSSHICGVFRALLQLLAVVPWITYPHLSHSTLLTASREGKGFEGSRPRGMMKFTRQRQMCPDWRYNLDPFCILKRSAMDVTHSLCWMLPDK